MADRAEAYSDLIRRALVFAARKHTASRKGTDVPYIIHPAQVAIILARHGYDDHVLAAAILHDVLEDTDTTPEDLSGLFGERVLHLILEVSEPQFDLPKDQTWEQRKWAKLEQLRMATPEALAICAADRLHNVSETLHEIAVHGSVVWQRFRRRPEKHLEFERAVLDILRERFPHPLTDEYAAALEELEKAPRL
jgi:(p)ppGpp synthase/HD superfamily hydrolase